MNLTGKILIVDDEIDSLDFFELMLTRLGFEVEKAVDGYEALDKVKQTNPDLILLDNKMPRLTGWEVTKILKNEKSYKKYSKIPIIMLSAMDTPQNKVEGLELGVEDYITKPFNFSEVLARIRVIFRHKELTGQLQNKEKLIGIIETLNKSLIAFTRHIKNPLNELLTKITEIDPNDKNSITNFLTAFKKEGHEIIATIEGLEDQIKEYENKDKNLKKITFSLGDLEKKIKKHLVYYESIEATLK